MFHAYNFAIILLLAVLASAYTTLNELCVFVMARSISKPSALDGGEICVMPETVVKFPLVTFDRTLISGDSHGIFKICNLCLICCLVYFGNDARQTTY